MYTLLRKFATTFLIVNVGTESRVPIETSTLITRLVIIFQRLKFEPLSFLCIVICRSSFNLRVRGDNLRKRWKFEFRMDV